VFRANQFQFFRDVLAFLPFSNPMPVFFILNTHAKIFKDQLAIFSFKPTNLGSFTDCSSNSATDASHPSKNLFKKRRFVYKPSIPFFSHFSFPPFSYPSQVFFVLNAHTKTLTINLQFSHFATGN
jgi:hypothetical protein